MGIGQYSHDNDYMVALSESFRLLDIGWNRANLYLDSAQYGGGCE